MAALDDKTDAASEPSLDPTDLTGTSKSKISEASDTPLVLENKDWHRLRALRVWELTKDCLDKDEAIFHRLEDYCKMVHESVHEVLEESKHVRDAPSVVKAPMPTSREESAEHIRILDEESRLINTELDKLRAVREATSFSALLVSPEGQIAALGYARWADAGFPQVQMGHKFCATLLLSGMGEDVIELVQPPWKAFFIEVPDGLLFIRDMEHDVDLQIRRILVTRVQNKHKGETWAYVAFSETTLTLWRFGMHTAELLPATSEGETSWYDVGDHYQELVDQDDRVVTLIGRLIVNTCLAMSDPTAVKPIGPGHKRYESARRRGEREPVVRTFVVGKPVKLDFRQTVQQVVRHGVRKLPTVQFLVRGHFRSQAHGPKMSLRKVIFIEPFWKSKEDAPILVRAHELVDKEALSSSKGSA
jgi:hypothetical protein